MRMQNDKINDNIQLTAGAVKLNWQGIHAAADAVKQAATGFSTRLQRVIANTKDNFNAVKTAGEMAADHVGNAVRESAQEVKSQLENREFQAATKAAVAGLSRVGEAIRKGGNAIGRKIEETASQVADNVKNLASETKSDVNEIGTSINAIQQKMQLTNPGNVNLSLPPNSQTNLLKYEFLDPTHMEAIKDLYRKLFPHRKINNDLMFMSEAEAIAFFQHIANNNYPPALGHRQSSGTLIYIGLDGREDTKENVQASYLREYNKHLQTIAEQQINTQPQTQYKIEGHNEDIAQDYIQYITGNRYDEDTPSERSLSIAPDGINAQEKGIFRFDKGENAIEFFQWQAAQNHPFLLHSLPDNTTFAVSIGNGNLYQGNFEEVRRQLVEEHQKQPNDYINIALIKLEGFRPENTSNEQRSINLSPVNAVNVEQGPTLKTK
jgi:hypothetical protein